jgi:hypothetical protein
MPLEFSKKKEETVDEFPETKEEELSIEEKHRRLELENAEMRGRLSAAKEQPRTPPQNSHEQTKARIYSDANSLDDEKFQDVYKMSKNQAMMTILERDAAISKAEAKRAAAEAEAKVEMATKYGSSFYQFKNQVEEAVADLSEEVKSDPSRLARAMERFYLSFQKEGVATRTKPDERKKMINDFEKPALSPPAEKKEQEEIPAAYKPFSKVFGIHSETERKELMQTIAEGEFVPMDMGNGYWFKSPERGFERVEPKGA